MDKNSCKFDKEINKTNSNYMKLISDELSVYINLPLEENI